ncbi:uncharacterized protein BDV14DRAFT_201219 [Aspergillus stella-maris]|uniref:uncharacterized protein n=1 Tax=Aspergillus stella-maris TaxID=1810926 RepID=UPI003CCC9564
MPRIYLIANSLNEFPDLLANNIRRLVIYFSPNWCDARSNNLNDIQLLFRKALSHFTAIEEFTPFNDEYWHPWPRLRRLAIFQPTMDDAFLEKAKACPDLKQLVISDPEWDSNYPIEPGPDVLSRLGV